MAAKKKKKLVFLRAVMHNGVTYLPDTAASLDNKAAQALIDKGAAEPYADVMPEKDQEPVVDEPAQGLEPVADEPTQGLEPGETDK